MNGKSIRNTSMQDQNLRNQMKTKKIQNDTIDEQIDFQDQRINQINESPIKKSFRSKNKLQIQTNQNEKYFQNDEIQSQILEQTYKDYQIRCQQNKKGSKSKRQIYSSKNHQQHPGKSPLFCLLQNPSLDSKKYKQYSNNNNNTYQNCCNQTIQERILSKLYLVEYLKIKGFSSGDYIEIKINNGQTFSPVYKILDLGNQRVNLISKTRKISDEEILQNNNENFINNNSMKRSVSKGGRDKKNSVSSHTNFEGYGLQFVLGSKIFLKHQKFNRMTKFTINKLKKISTLKGVYMHINVIGKGYLSCNLDGQNQQNSRQRQAENYKQFPLVYDDFECQKAQNVWKCILIDEDEAINKNYGEQLQTGEQKYIIRFQNFFTGRYLTINQQKQFQLDQENQKGSKFLLRRSNQSNQNYRNQFILQIVTDQAKSASDYQTSKNRQHLSYEEGKKRSSPNEQKIRIQLVEYEEPFITLQQQLFYIKHKLYFSPSLKLIENILQTMIPYSMPQFLHSVHIVSEYIQKVLYQHKILHLTSEFLLEFLTHSKDGLIQLLSYSNEGRQINENNHVSMGPRRNVSKPRMSLLELNFYQNQYLTFGKIMKYLNKLCFHSKNNSQVFLIILDFLFSNPSVFYLDIISLVKDNFYFVSQFYKRQWYHKIMTFILHQNPEENQLQVFQPYLLVLEAFCIVGKKPHIQNQFLIFHTIKQSQFQAKNILLNLYVDGLYIFIHQNNKDMELLTCLEKKSSESFAIGSPFLNRISQIQQVDRESKYRNSKNSVMSQRNRRNSLLQMSPSLLNSLNRIILYLQIMRMITFGCNYPILKKYQVIIDTFLSYCYKKKFPVIKDFDFVRWVLKCAVAFQQPQSQELSINPKYKIGIVENISTQSKFRQKFKKSQENNFNLFRADKDIFTPKLTQVKCEEMCSGFLLKCSQYYSHISSKAIQIDEIFQTKSVMGDPIQQYFDFLKMLFSNRIFKFKQKKKAQFMQYIEKLFQNVFPQNEKSEQSEDTLMTTFIKFLLKIVSFDKDYRSYLQKLKIKANYNETKILQNPLNINKKVTVRRLNIFNCDQECNKITRIKLLNKYFDRQKKKKKQNNNQPFGEEQDGKKSRMQYQNIELSERQNKQELFRLFNSGKQHKQTSQKQNQHKLFQKDNNSQTSRIPNLTNMNLVNRFSKIQKIDEDLMKNMSLIDLLNSTNLLKQSEQTQKVMSLKQRALELLILIILNINEQYIEQSVETLNYFIKNPTILNWSTFQLFASVPKYQNEFSIKKRIIEQWYLTSEPETFELLTTVLRLLFRKVNIHINRLSNIQIITTSELSQISICLQDNFKQLSLMSKTINSWLKEQLFSQNSESFGYFSQKLQNVAMMLNKTNQLKDCNCISVSFEIKKTVFSLSLLDWLRPTLIHIEKQYKRCKILLQKSSIYNNSKKNNIESYSKVILSYIENISFILDFLTQPIALQKIQQSQQNGVYRVEYETNLQYAMAILCILGQNLCQISQTQWIVLKILQIAKTHYGIVMIKYLSENMLINIVKSKHSFLELLNLIVTFKENQIIEFSLKYFNFLKQIDPKQLSIRIKELTSSTLSKSKKYKRKYSSNCIYENNEQQDSEGQTQHSLKLQNSWFYFIYKLSVIQKKYSVQSYYIPLLKYFHQNILFIILENQVNYDELTQNLKSKKSSSQKVKQLKKIRIQIQRKKYIAYFISDYVEAEIKNFPLKSSQSLKRSGKRNNISSLNNTTKYEDQSVAINLYLTNAFVDITFFQKLQRLIISENNLKHPKNSIIKEFQSLILDFSQYYVYDLMSLLYLLGGDLSQNEKIHSNLTNIHNKFILLLKNSNAGLIQRHYSQIAIEQFLKKIQQRRDIPKIKNPRHNFQPGFHLKCGNVRNIIFLQGKQIKKMQTVTSHKWKKAVKALQAANLSGQNQFLYEIDHFPQIYGIKTKQQLSTIINNEDLLRKLISVNQNLGRTIKSVENKIFILSQIKRLIKSKYFTHLINEEKSRQILAEMILEQLSEEQIVEEKSINYSTANNLGVNSINHKNNHWNQNIFTVCLKLDIVSKLQYFAHQYTLNSLQILITLLKKARKTFYEDSNKISIARGGFNDVEINLEPLYLILDIISEQIFLEYISESNLRQIIEEVYIIVLNHVHFSEYQWAFDQDNSSNFTFLKHRQILLKLTQKLGKDRKSIQLFKKISNNYSNQHIVEENLPQQNYTCFKMLEKIQIRVQNHQQSSNKEKDLPLLTLLGLNSKGLETEKR